MCDVGREQLGSFRECRRRIWAWERKLRELGDSGSKKGQWLKGVREKRKGSDEGYLWCREGSMWVDLEIGERG